ncbi:MAG: GAF domain-containing protein [Anaerolineales bacterium]|nr:MAG: GAF domain-containing protein [Anaerolineales bacterium]
MGSDSPSDAAELGAVLKYLTAIITSSGHALLPNFGDQLLQSIVDAAGQIFGAAAASIALVDYDQNMLEFVVAFGHGNRDVIGQRIPLDAGIAGYVVMTGQPIAIADVLQDPRFNQDFAKSTGYVPNSILATPLEWQERVIGVMEVLDKIEAPRFDLRDMELLGLFARQASIAIAQSQQYDLIAEALLQSLSTWVEQGAPAELRSTLEEVLEANAGSGRLRDLSQVMSVLHELTSSGEPERKMALDVLEAIRNYLTQRASRLNI